ncbi:MAG: hypothetical protein IPG66_05235 [Hydrogenophilales bacterium]|nr:hypothetical protein [Hydrogenophilales bacterium]
MKIFILETLTYRGPNRHCERTVFEQTLRCDADIIDYLSGKNRLLLDQLDSALSRYGLLSKGSPHESIYDDIDLAEGSAFRPFVLGYAGLAVLFQRAGNHQVDWLKASFTNDDMLATVCYEYDDDDIGMEAGLLALDVLRSLPCLEGRLQITLEGDELPYAPSSLEEKIQAFLKRAETKALPGDTHMLIKLALERGIPYAKGDRYPFRALNPFRVRLNGGLRLGFGIRQHVLDGTLCLDQAGKAMALWQNAVEKRRFLERLNAPLPMRDPDAENCNSLLRALRSAKKLGYPVSVKPIKPMDGGLPWIIHSDRELESAVHELQRSSRQMIVERHVEGQEHHLIFANNALVEVITDAGHWQNSLTHRDYLRLGDDIARELGTGLFALTVVTPDLSKSPKQGYGVVMDLSVAPEVDRITKDAAAHAHILGEFMNWLYPSSRATRIPIVAITGTNGKTTTSRMINSILVEIGGVTGLACTDGVYIAGQKIRQGDSSGFLFHHQILQDTRVTHAVLETARGAILHTGFAYDACDIGVCTNVSDDHLGEFGVNTLDEMASLKLSILKRAKSGAVLNADDPYARSMFDELNVPRICLTSLEKARSSLHGWDKRDTETLYAAIESYAGREWLTLYEGAAILPVIPVDDIPATFAGTARHNVSNALQAVAASYLLGVQTRDIRLALSQFNASYENAPGRLNVVQETPFRVILDYAHNADGYRILADFMDRQACAGRKILLIGLPGRSRVEAIREIAKHIAGHFDRYICRDSKKLKGHEPGELPELMKAELCIQGVPVSAIDMKLDEEEAVKFALEVAHSGDLVVLCVTSLFREEVYQSIQNFGRV